MRPAGHELPPTPLGIIDSHLEGIDRNRPTVPNTDEEWLASDVTAWGLSDPQSPMQRYSLSLQYTRPSGSTSLTGIYPVVIRRNIDDEVEEMLLRTADGVRTQQEGMPSELGGEEAERRMGRYLAAIHVAMSNALEMCTVDGKLLA